MSEGHMAVTSAIRSVDGPAICAYLTAGYPSPQAFSEIFKSVADVADVVEIGVPFSDPMADGQTIQAASHAALGHGVTLEWILETVSRAQTSTPLLLMGYYNPFLSHGLARLVEDMGAAGLSGLIVPDLPLEESAELRQSLDAQSLGLVQLVAPTTPRPRIAEIAAVSRGFVYAVSTTGVTGGATSFDEHALGYLDAVKEVSPIPVLAGFGIRAAYQVAQLAAHVDGVVVGSALIDAIDAGDDPARFISSLRLGVSA